MRRVAKDDNSDDRRKCVDVEGNSDRAPCPLTDSRQTVEQDYCVDHYAKAQAWTFVATYWNTLTHCEIVFQKLSWLTAVRSVRKAQAKSTLAVSIIQPALSMVGKLPSSRSPANTTYKMQVINSSVS